MELSGFAFLEQMNSIAALNARKMEDLLYEDPGSSVVKARLFAESVLDSVFDIEGINIPSISSLHDKISYLTKEGFITADIQSAFDTVRLSGNKAAHDGTFDDLVLGLRLHRVVYKIAVWYSEVYASKHVTIPPYESPKPKHQELNVQELVKQHLQELIRTGQVNVEGLAVLGNNALEDSDTPRDPDEGMQDPESHLLQELKRLQDSSKEAVEGSNQLSQFKQYLHVERQIQQDAERILTARQGRAEGNLILLCGSVGDGKSHLLAYLKENRQGLVQNYQIYNDATESFSPSKNSLETLEEILLDFSDQRLMNCSKNVILAINMGVLHNFISVDRSSGVTYSRLTEFIDASGVFSDGVTTYYSDKYFDLISFADYHPYELTKNGPVSIFFSGLLKKVMQPTKNNPFYSAYLKDVSKSIRSMVHENYEFMQDEYVQMQIVGLIIQTLVKSKMVLSARAFLNFVADILVPTDTTPYNLLTEIERIRNSLPSLVFGRRERSEILKAIDSLDPIHIRSAYTDDLLVSLNTLHDWNKLVGSYVKSKKGSEWLLPFTQLNNLAEHSFSMFSEELIRVAYLSNSDFVDNLNDDKYLNYVGKLYGFNNGNKASIKATYDEVRDALFKWQGSPLKDYIYINKKQSGSYMLAQKLNLKPMSREPRVRTEDGLQSFKSSIVLTYHDGTGSNTTSLEIDYQLFDLLQKVRDGYRPNKRDEEEAARFVEFIERIMRFGEKKQELIVHFTNDDRLYSLKRDDFGAFVFERES